jgi:hypothetical protein
MATSPYENGQEIAVGPGGYDKNQYDRQKLQQDTGVNTSVVQGRDGNLFFDAGKVTDPNYGTNKAWLQGTLGGVLNREAQTMQGAQAQGATINTASQDQIRAAQLALMGNLQNTAAGQGPSVAQEQLRQATDRNMANALAMAAAQGGGAAAYRQAAFARAAATQDMASQSAQLRAQEIAQAQNTLAGVAQGARGQDIGLAAGQAQMTQQNAQFNAGLAQDTGKTNLLAGVEQQKMKDQIVQQYLAMGMSLDQAQFQAEIQQRQYNAGVLAQQEGIRQGVAVQQGAQTAQMVGAGLAAAGTMAAAALSDKRAKKDIAAGDIDVEALMDALKAQRFSYKDERNGTGPRVGIMAQDAMKAPMGRDMVFEDEDGNLKLDTVKALSAALAANANLHKRVKALEGA